MSPLFRETVLSTYPALAPDTDKARVYRRIMQYVLFGTYRFGTVALLFPRETILSFAADCPGLKWQSAAFWIEEFSRDVLPLNPTSYSRVEGEAREIRPEIPPHIVAAKELELVRDLKTPRKRVDFVTGEPVSTRAFRHLQQLYRDHLAALRAEDARDHPAAELIEYLNSQAPHTLERVLTHNWGGLEKAARLMPNTTPREQRRREWAFRVLESLQDERQMVYRSSQRTPRIHAYGTNIHMLPRELRKVALQGCVSLDLRACQLAVVGRLWGVPSLVSLLKSDQSVWGLFLDYLELPGSMKPALKTAMYSICFGMGERRLRRELAEGTELEEGIGPERARAFFRHRLIKDLLAARRREFGRVEGRGRVADAFGRTLSVGPGQGVHQVLAQQAQSYEVKLMLGAVPVLKARQREVTVVSWLHDGIVVKLHDRTKQERTVQELIDAVNGQATRLGLNTSLQQDN